MVLCLVPNYSKSYHCVKGFSYINTEECQNNLEHMPPTVARSYIHYTAGWLSLFRTSQEYAIKTLELLSHYVKDG